MLILIHAVLLLLLTCVCAFADFADFVVSVLDGDTIEVLHNNRPERIRLSGIDCPEKGQAFGKKAKQFTSTLVYGKEVTIQVFRKDRHGRTVADVILPNGTNVSRELVREGLAWWYRQYSKDESLGALEEEAYNPTVWEVHRFLFSTLDLLEGYAHHRPEHASAVARFSQELRRLKDELMSSFEAGSAHTTLLDSFSVMRCGMVSYRCNFLTGAPILPVRHLSLGTVGSRYTLHRGGLGMGTKDERAKEKVFRDREEATTQWTCYYCPEVAITIRQGAAVCGLHAAHLLKVGWA